MSADTIQPCKHICTTPENYVCVTTGCLWCELENIKKMLRKRQALEECEICEAYLAAPYPDGSLHSCVCLGCWNGIVKRVEQAEAKIAIARRLMTYEQIRQMDAAIESKAVK